MFNSLWPSDAIRQHKSGSTLDQVMACCLMAPSHFLNQHWLLISKLLQYSPRSNFTVSTWATILWWWWVWKWYFINSLPHPTGLMSLTFCSSHDIVPYIKSTLVAVAWHSPISAPNNTILHRAGSRFAPSQWETELLCNYVSHWLGTSLESALLHVDHQLQWKVSLQPGVGLL